MDKSKMKIWGNDRKTVRLSVHPKKTKTTILKRKNPTLKQRNSLQLNHQLSLTPYTHLTDQREFYQLLTFKDDVDLDEKLNQWENFDDFERPHFGHDGKTP